jgi:hypothetical protein
VRRDRRGRDSKTGRANRKIPDVNDSLFPPMEVLLFAEYSESFARPGCGSAGGRRWPIFVGQALGLRRPPRGARFSVPAGTSEALAEFGTR